ncbi:S8 family serine peptidase [Nocardioides coralli]|uniref:S8 family serine peptidase n=1 Tax=Nocardioides coralli TaxID=2872154 RepID=UPI001CA44562|nr:S8 family serine peptidase [Nocardioides coralli]QZY28657.1 S8 family serine peptidase [Nocardioides coralli]
MVRRGRRARCGLATVPLLVALTGALAVAPLSAAHGDDAEGAALHLVTFDEPGTAGRRGDRDPADVREQLRDRQDSALARVSAPEPVYRWTTALSGVAVELTDRQATELRSQPDVALVEQNAVRPLATAAAPAASAPAPQGRGGAGVVVGVVDTGIWPESPVFGDSPGIGPRPARFVGACTPAEDWDRGVCNDKLVAAAWFVDGFGEDAVAADEPLSPRDVRGHGTQVASIAAGNAGVTVSAPGLRGDYSGVAPRARLAAYKACWSAPDPEDDGCATADLVSAIDRATRDGVDVLNLSVAGAPGIDTVERALLGAAEAGTVVMAAAGNDGADGYATHVSPWVTTVGGLTSVGNAGGVVLGRGERLDGLMTARRPVRAAAVVARDIAAPGRTARDAARCAPGSLDAARASGRVVVCERGVVGRVAKSAAVDLAGGVGMVLVNVRRGELAHDLHAVPTVHLGRGAGRTLLARLSSDRGRTITLAPSDARRSAPRVAGWSPAGDPQGSVLKPDLVGGGTGVLSAVPPTVAEARWAFLSGTSAATARASGAAATLLARRGWSPDVVRSVLAGSGRDTGDSVIRSGSGALDLRAAQRGRLAHTVGPRTYRRWLAGKVDEVNAPSLLFRGDGTAKRRVTNVGGRADTWRAEVSGFERHAVTVSPSTVTLRPGRSATYRVTVSGSEMGGLDDGAITWVAGDGSRVRVPVAIGR